MPTKYPSRIPADIRALLIEYHTYYRDTDIKPVKTIWYKGYAGDTKYPAYLVRVKDERGAAISCIDTADDYVTEVETAARDEENDLVVSFLDNRENYEWDGDIEWPSRPRSGRSRSTGRI